MNYVDTLFYACDITCTVCMSMANALFNACDITVCV